MTTPPDFGGTEIEKGLAEDLGVPADEIEPHRLRHGDGLPNGDHEAHAPGQVCAICGNVIAEGQNVRRRPADGWVHEVCPPVGLGTEGPTDLPS
jgi:hypothetical protein